MTKIRPSFLIFMNKFGDVPLRCVEIGVRDGDNAYEMLSYAPKIHLTLVDPYLACEEEPSQEKMDTHYGNMLSKLDKFRDRITIIKKTSEEASKMFNDKHFDYIYIDGDHTHSEVMKDIICWDRKVKDFGITAGHDFYAVKKAVFLLYERTGRIVYYCGVANSSFISSEYTDCLDWWVHNEVHVKKGD